MMDDPDVLIRQRARVSLGELCLLHGNQINAEVLERGFEVGGIRHHYLSRAIGIFKPKSMSAALSIKTSVPRAGRRARYADQGVWYRGDSGPRIDAMTGLLRYDLQAGGPDKPANRHLRAAFERRAPLIWFMGVKSGVYEPLFPVWIVHFGTDSVLLAAHDPAEDLAELSRLRETSGEPVVQDAPIEIAPFWREAPRRQRGHQAWFSQRTKSAYGWRCAFTSLPVRDLLVGAHIIPDAEGGLPSVQNGICMSALHHLAFDANLIGVDASCKVHVSPRLQDHNDGTLLESLKHLDGSTIQVPQNKQDQPNPDWLNERFRTFRETLA